MGNFLDKVNKILVGGLTAVIVFCFSVIFWIFPATTKIPLWIVPVLTIVFYLVVIVVYAIQNNSRDEIYRLPSVKKIVKKTNEMIFIVEKNDLFNINSLVSIYYEDDIQILLGIGYVETINEKGSLQVKFYKLNDEHSKIIESLEDNSKTRMSLKMKPSVNINILKGE